MVNIKDNTVPGNNQMVANSKTPFIGNPDAKLRILVLGNSITRHGPNYDIGWPYCWGMAASAEDKDYVHRLHAKLTEANVDTYIMVRNASCWERGFLKDDIFEQLKDEKDFCPNIVVLRLGENVLPDDKPYFKDGLRKFMNYICSDKTRVLFTTCFWQNEIIDNAIKEIASERGEVCLDGYLAYDESNMALGLFEHSGVAMHPGDKGMEKIADLIFDGIKELI